MHYKNLIVLLVLLPLISFSQNDNTSNDDYEGPTSKGKWLIGGGSNLFFNSTDSKVESNNQEIDTGSTLSISFAPSAGYFVANGLAIGLELPVSFSKRKDDDFNLEVRTTSFIAAPFVRYYFNGDKIKPFVQGNVGFGRSKSKVSEGSFTQDPFDPVILAPVETTSDIFTFGFNGGIAIFLNDNVSIDLGIGYNNLTTDVDDESDLKFKNNTIGFQAGFNVFL